ncbi:MAG TPA: hypothetical protein VH370_03850 [Humisphaera sp.]|nr:hypothetical protein [Humisphaera sp.]
MTPRSTVGSALADAICVSRENVRQGGPYLALRDIRPQSSFGFRHSDLIRISGIRFSGFAAILILVAILAISGCAAPSARIPFPAQPIERSQRGWFYDVHGKGHADFGLLPDESGKLDVVAYDDDHSGRFNRRYRLSDYANDDVPHLILLLDSIPFDAFMQRYHAGRLAWFDTPQKLIPPFPSMTELIYTRVLHAPPLPGMIDQYYDPETGQVQNDVLKRALSGYEEPWERRLHYHASMFESGLAYIDPRPWLGAELERARVTFNDSPDRITLVYFSSASCILSRYGATGLDELVDGVERLCLRLFYERQGAIKISILADHGHNLMASKNISLADPLKAAGFRVTDRINGPDDVVLEINGLVTYAAVRTWRPEKVAASLAVLPQIELAMYLDGERVIVRSSRGSAAVECKNRRVRYVPLDADVLNYSSVVDALKTAGKADADGFASDNDWFAATLDHQFPDAPRRVWDAFHGTAVHPPEVMLTLKDGFCAGLPEYEKYIKMASTHGGLNQLNSATAIMSMTGRVKGPLKSKQVLSVLEPGFEPAVRK